MKSKGNKRGWLVLLAMAVSVGLIAFHLGRLAQIRIFNNVNQTQEWVEGNSKPRSIHPTPEEVANEEWLFPVDSGVSISEFEGIKQDKDSEVPLNFFSINHDDSNPDLNADIVIYGGYSIDFCSDLECKEKWHDHHAGNYTVITLNKEGDEQ
jgi:hypothetical protein